MTDLKTTYLGLPLKNPLVASSSPLWEHLDHVRELEDAGGAAVILPSLFEEQIELESLHLDRALSHGIDSYAESLSYFPDLMSYNQGPDGYLEHLRRARAAVGIPVIASLNGNSEGGWIRYAKLMEEAGAAAIELNIYDIPTDPEVTAAILEERYAAIVESIKSCVRIPVAVKLGPYFTAFANFAVRLDEAGIDGLVIFNRFYQPDLDLEGLSIEPNLVLSSPDELRLRLHWAAILYGRVGADIAITGGIHSAEDVLKSMMAGATAAMMTSALLKFGIGHLTTVLGDLERWLDEHEYESVTQMRGSLSLRSAPDATAYERANYMKVLSSYALRMNR
jgi:dihydroorotate dehydrogenase (fumarate)